jgi:hypothetical protein
MWARRFLILVVVITLAVVAGAFLIFQFGADVLRQQTVPQGSYQEPPPNSGPDYSKLENWVAHPAMAERQNPARWLPGGGAPSSLVTGKAAAFFIHPTTYLQRNRWNAPLAGDRQSDGRVELFVRSQASAFSSVADVWAPRYRQAAYGAFLLDSKDAQQALDLAYSDVRRAFEAFLSAIPQSQPLILAGHSQGSLHLTRLLTEFGPALKGRIVAAYVAGWPVSTAADLPAMRLAPCTAADQAGCVISWQSFGDPANPALILDAWEGTRGPAGVERRQSDMLCVNPLTGTAGGQAPPQANPGTLVPTAGLLSAMLLPDRVGARCEDGFLILSGDIPPLGPFVLPGNNYHVYDYALFWAAIRRDAERRAGSWFQQNGSGE